MSKAVEFTLIGKTQEEVEGWAKDLAALCTAKEMELQEARYFGSFLMTHAVGDPTKNISYRYSLIIPKVQHVTYNEIYAMVNSVKGCSFRTIQM